MDFPLYASYEWWLKWYAVWVITDEGVYAEKMVPDDYGGPQLTVEVIQRVIFATENGYMWEQRYDDFTTVQDFNRLKGVGVNIEAFEEVIPEEFIIGPGPSGEVTTWHGRENTAFLSTRGKLIVILKKTLGASL